MEFKKGENFLEKLFEEENFYALEVHSKEEKVYECGNGTEIYVVYPGYKASSDNYDYRVDIKKNSEKIPLSHANIIADIYNKSVNEWVDLVKFKYLLIEVFKEKAFEFEKYEEFYEYRPNRQPSKEIIDRIDEAHKSKEFKREGNQWDLNFEELFHSIKWIVIQEDLNYPMEKGYEGRKMPLARYVETIYCSQKDDHELEQVIERAIVHNKRPRQWKEIDYSFLDDIG